MLRRQLLGRIICDFQKTETGFVVVTDIGERVEIILDVEGGPGADNERYNTAVLKAKYGDKTLVIARK